MTTLFQVLLDVARTCGVLVSGTATGGSATALADSTRLEQDDYFNGGTLFFRSGTGLINTTAKVTDYTGSSGTFTFATQTAVSAGIIYSACNQSRDTLVQAINLALTHMGVYTAVNEALLLVDGTLEYTLPAGVSNVVRVEAPVLFDTVHNNLAYAKQYQWEEYAGKLRLKYPITGAYGSALRVYYNSYHAEVQNDSDVINDLFNRQRLMWTAAYMFEYERMQFTGNADQKETMLMQTASMREMQLAQTFPVRSIPRDPILEVYR